MICSVHCAEWNPVPTAAYRAVDMPEENVPDVGIIAHDLVNPLRVIPEVNIIKDGDTDFKRGMVHEKVNRNIPGSAQLITEPFTAFIAVGTPVCTMLHCVQHQETACRSFQNMLNKTMLITRHIWKYFTKYLPMVMVAHQWVTRHLQALNYVTKIAVCLDISPVCKVTCNYAEFSVRMMLNYIFNTCIKTITGIKFVETCSSWYQMSIGDLD